MGCKLFDKFGRHGDCANCPYDCDEPNAETAVSEDVDEEDEMNEQSFTDVALDLRQAVAKQMGGHQAYVQTKVDALVAAHKREMFGKKVRNCDRFESMAQARASFFKERHPMIVNQSFAIRGMQMQFDAWMFEEASND